MPVGAHQLPHDVEEVGHDLLLAVAESLVLEEEEAYREPVLEVLDVEKLVDRPLRDLGEQGEPGRQQGLRRSPFGGADEVGRAPPREP